MVLTPTIAKTHAMDLLIKLILPIHVIAGFSSLILFFVPAVARKGGAAHNRFGRYYVYGMWTVVVTAFLLSVINYFDGREMIAILLGFLAVLTARPLYYGLAVLRHKRGPSTRMKRIDLGFRAVLAVASPYLIGAGLGWWGPGESPLFIVFAVLGIASSWPTLIGELRQRKTSHNWLMEHIGEMIATAIAAFTAFFVFGGVRLFGDLFTGSLSVVVWTAPTVLGVIFSQWYKRRIRAGKIKLGTAKPA